MTGTDTSLDESQARRALEHWDLPAPVDHIEPGGGTANASVIVYAGHHTWVLKRRNPRYSREPWVVFDHALMAHLRARGIPVPVPLPAHDGRTWVRMDGDIYEFAEFMPGDEHRVGDAAQVHAAGEMLARFHLASSDFEPPADKTWERYHSPADIVEGLATVRAQAGAVSPEDARLLDLVQPLAEELPARLPDDAYRSLPRTIVHGDWHPGNLKFSGDRVAGVFDFDWCTSQPRMVDVADGLWFLCGHRPEPVVPGDIWSLTQSFEMDAELVGAFGEGYVGLVTPTEAELLALPELMCARWLYCRVDAAVRKVEPERRVEFIARDLLGPLRWLDENESAIADGSLLQHT